MRRAASSATPPRFERAQIGDRAGKHESQFLRLRAAGIVDHAAIGGRERAAKPCAASSRDQPAKCGASSVQGTGCRVAAMCAERIEADAQVASAGSSRASSPARRHRRRRPRRGAEIEVDGDAGIEIDAIEHALQRRAGSRGRSLALTEPGRRA